MAESLNVLYSAEFQPNLYPDNSFYVQSKVDSAPAPNVTQIVIPQSAAAISSTFGTVQSGQANLATANSLAAKVRLNDILTYNVNVFGTEPTALQLIDLATINYDKRQELFKEHADVLNTDVANFSAIALAQDTANAGLIAKTTSTATRANTVTGGYVGNVKRIAKEDIIEVKRLFHAQNLPNINGSLYALITPEQWQDLLLIPEFVDYEKTGNETALRQGMVGTLMGFRFFIRQNDSFNANVIYNPSTNVKVAFGAAATTTETSAAIFWHSGMVRRAQGSASVYTRLNDPLYKADIFSTELRYGFTKSRTDGKGVVSLVEATA